MKYLESYLKIINKLTFKKINSTSLLSIVETDRICPKAVSMNCDYKNTMCFHEKNKEWTNIKEYIGSKAIYIWITDSEWCGLCPLDSIDDFNIDFNYCDEPMGIIILISDDGKKDVVLDFYEECDGEKLIDIEYRHIDSENHGSFDPPSL